MSLISKFVDMGPFTKFTLIIVSLVKFSICSGQVIEFKSESGRDVTFNAIKTYQQNFIIGGNEGNKLLFCEINSAGTILSSNTVIIGDESTTPCILSMIIDSDNNIIATGYRQNTPSTATGFVIKYDYENTEIIWAKSIENEGSYLHCVIEPNADDDYLICGQNFNFETGQEALVIQADRNTGELTTLSNINNGSNAETFYSIAYKDGQIQASSRLTINEGTVKMRACKVTLNPLGDVISNQTYLSDPLTENARLYAFNIKYVGADIFMTIHGDASGVETNKDLYIIKFDSTGEAIWLNKFDFLNYEFDGSWNSVTSEGSNIFYFGNLKDGSLDEKGNIFIIKSDTTGELFWAKTYEFETNYAFNHPDALLANSNKLFAVGAKYIESELLYAGTILITSQDDGAIDLGCYATEPMNLISDTLASYEVLSSQVENSFSIIDATVLSAPAASLLVQTSCNPVGIQSIDIKNTSIIYPNPTSGVLRFEIAKSSTEILSLEIISIEGICYNVFGNKYVYNYSDNLLTLDLAKFSIPNGIYFIKIKTNEGYLVKRFQYLK